MMTDESELSDKNHFSESEYITSDEEEDDEEELDVREDQNGHRRRNGQEDKREESMGNVINKFSIDSILGLNSKNNKAEEENDDKMAKFVKPTPIPAAPRPGP